MLGEQSRLTGLICFWLRRNYSFCPEVFSDHLDSDCIVVDVVGWGCKVVVYDGSMLGSRACLSSDWKQVVLGRVVVIKHGVGHFWLDPCDPGFFSKLGVVLDEFC